MAIMQIIRWRGINIELLTGAIIFVITYLIFLASHVYQSADSKYSMLVGESLWYHRSFTLDHYRIPGFYPAGQNGETARNGVYQLELVNGHIYYAYPPGSSVLSVPYIIFMNALGVSSANPDGAYNPKGEMKIESGLAALLMAAFVTTLFYTGRLLLTLYWSVVIAIGSALGTQIWSTASRAMWSDTWGVFLMGLVIWMLLSEQVRAQPLRPVMLASLLSWSFFVRPTSSLPIMAVTIYLILFHRSLLARFAVTGALWLAGFVAYSWHTFGKLLPTYYAPNKLSFESFWMPLAGHLISPSRGLLIFVPTILFIIYLLIHYARALTSLRLVALALGIIAAHLIMISGFPIWWGGHCYGPRLATGLVPWFALLGILGMKARQVQFEDQLSSLSRFFKWGELTIGGTLLSLSIAVNGVGATAQRTWWWNVRPVNIDEHPERVWDWKNPQFLASQYRD